MNGERKNGGAWIVRGTNKKRGGMDNDETAGGAKKFRCLDKRPAGEGAGGSGKNGHLCFSGASGGVIIDSMHIARGGKDKNGVTGGRGNTRGGRGRTGDGTGRSCWE